MVEAIAVDKTAPENQISLQDEGGRTLRTLRRGRRFRWWWRLFDKCSGNLIMFVDRLILFV